MTNTTEALIAHALVVDTLDRPAMQALRAAFRADGVTNANVRDIVAPIATCRDMVRHDAGERVRAIWSCV